MDADYFNLLELAMEKNAVITKHLAAVEKRLNALEKALNKAKIETRDYPKLYQDFLDRKDQTFECPYGNLR